MSNLNNRRSDAVRWRRFATMVALLLIILPSLAQAGDETLLLDVQINGHSIGKIAEFSFRNGTLLARQDELTDIGIRTPLALSRRNDPPAESNGLIALSSLSGLTWRLDRKTQTVYFAAEDSRLVPNLLRLDENDHTPSTRVIESGTGVTLNYDISGTRAAGQMAAAGSLDLRAFSPKGVLSSGLLAYAGGGQSTSGAKSLVRLDTTYSFADVRSLRRYSVGDFITAGLSWTRPVRLLGAQVRSDFTMRPDLVTFPMPTVNGSVAVPSTLEVLADGNPIMSRQIDPGPFEIPQLPVISGAGTISMMVTNALGQQVNVTQAFYASPALLAPGLQTFSVQAGLVRRNWGTLSNEYGKLAGTAVYRRGLTRKFTIEGTAEGAAGTAMAGLGSVWQVGNLGIVNATFAGSGGTESAGGLFSIGAQRMGRRFSLGASATIASPRFRDLAADNGEPVPQQQINANAGVSLRRLGSLGCAFGDIKRDVASSLVAQAATSPQHSRILSANYSIQVRRLAIYASEFSDFGNGGASAFQVGITMPMGRRRSAGVGMSSGGARQVQAQQAAAAVGEWGYQTYASSGDTTHEFVQGEYKARWGLVTAGLDSNDGKLSLRLENQGALSFVDGGFFPSNTIYDSFAVVDTNHLANIRVLQENRRVGKTNSAGRMLLPDLRAFDLNHIAIEATDVPPDVAIDNTTRDLRPQDRSGVVVKFRVKVSHGALLRLVDQAGAPLAVGSTATLKATGVTVPVGFDGDAYVEGLELHNEVKVELASGGNCIVVFDYRALPGDIPTIGPLSCREKRP